MPPPPLSIVIPTHDTRELTLRCLDSLAAAPAAGMEVILIDDASADGTAAAVAARHPGVTVLRNGEPARFTRSANRGLAAATGEILLLLNSDTEVAAGGLARLVAAFAREPELGIAGALLHYPDGSPQWSGGREPTLAWFFALSSGLPALLAKLPFYRRAKPLTADRPRAVDWVTGAAMAFRRPVWEAVGPLDEGFDFYAQDLDFCLRARRAGFAVEIRPDFPVLHHHGATIGREAGARGRQHPELLLGDLLRWARKHRGPAWAARAERALRAGDRVRRALAILPHTV
ncbi:MAG TPA: glycosyltransferase family 2 protein [Thermoanaerobaculia bacterium]|jgi:GT2 family glycosyltransferase